MSKKSKEELNKNFEKEKISLTEISKELKDSYLSYAMSVIVARALPDVRDGLKPVQRRILWALWDMGLTHNAKFKKSANVVGEVLGKYHPHGDMAVYDALARMAQDFSYRYPLIDGQGNWGSIDGDSPAAMRYTEARLSKIAEELLKDIEKETVDWQPNYDNSRSEPKVLPAKFPNLLVNGTMGIAVGMATSIPPHNLAEVIDALIYLLDNPQKTVKDLMNFIKGPDFPTGGIVFVNKNLIEAYTNGKGVILVRGLAEIEERKSGTFNIVISEIPYQVNKADLIAKIAELVVEKKIDGIKDIRDESDREGLRIVIELKNETIAQKVLNQLYQYTDLQKNFYVNSLALIDGLQPKLLSLKEILVYYLDFRRGVIKRRTEFDLKKTKERVHILEGLVKALTFIDEIISTIKKSKDRNEAKNNLIKKFKLTEIQADAILEIKLQTLAALERQKIEDELKEKKKLIDYLINILKNPKKIDELIKEELLILKDNFKSERRTKILKTEIKEFKEEDLIPEEETIITLTQAGYIKRMSPESFKTQQRGGKGLIGVDLKEEDKVFKFILANSHDHILFFTNKGRVFQTRAYELPLGNRVAKGKLIHNFLSIPENENISAIIAYSKNEKGYLIMATKKGLIKKCSLEEFKNIRKSGLWAINLKKDDDLVGVKLLESEGEIILATALGKIICFPDRDLRPMSRNATGVLGIKLKKDDFVNGLDIFLKDKTSEKRKFKILTVMNHGYAKQTLLKEYKIQKRGGMGIIGAKITQRTGLVVGIEVIDESYEELIVFSEKGQAIKIPLKGVRLTSRAAQGVKLMNLTKDDKIVGFVCL